jgi:hypothetical protein
MLPGADDCPGRKQVASVFQDQITSVQPKGRSPRGSAFNLARMFPSKITGQFYLSGSAIVGIPVLSLNLAQCVELPSSSREFQIRDIVCTRLLKSIDGVDIIATDLSRTQSFTADHMWPVTCLNR